MPLCFGASGSVRHASQIQSASWPPVVKTFWPLMTYSSPSRTARVRQRREVGAGAGLAVADGEVHLAGEDRGRNCCFCSSDPNRMQRRADGVEGHERQRHARAVRLVEEEVLLERGVALTAVLLRPAQPELAVAAHLANELAVRLAAGIRPLERGPALGGHERLEVVAQLASGARAARATGRSARARDCNRFQSGPDAAAQTQSGRDRCTRPGSGSAGGARTPRARARSNPRSAR